MTAGPNDLGDENDFVPPMPAPFVSPDEDSPEGVVAHMTTELRRQRLASAGLAKGLAYRELDGRMLKEKLEAEFRAAGQTKTDAEKNAKTHPEYVAFCRGTADMERRKADADALAEVARLLIQARLATMMEGVL